LARIAQNSGPEAVGESPAPARDGAWITLAQACSVLCVNESTLRRWSDAGQVRTFRTPGGHRRFSQADLQSLTAPAPHASQAEREDLGELALARIRRRLQRPRQADVSWYQQLGEEERLRLRMLGRRLVALISAYLAKRARKSRLIEEARGIGREYGHELGRNGTPLRDALAAFMFFRRSLDETAKELPKSEYLERIAVESRGQVRVVPVSKIDYITASGPYAELHVGEGGPLIGERHVADVPRVGGDCGRGVVDQVDERLRYAGRRVLLEPGLDVRGRPAGVEGAA